MSRSRPRRRTMLAVGALALLTSATLPSAPAATAPASFDSALTLQRAAAPLDGSQTRVANDTSTTPSYPVIAAAGDIACSPGDSHFKGGAGTVDNCREMATSDLLVKPRIDRVLTLGDNQYDEGSLANFGKSYGPSWGRVKAKTSPAVGNHEYRTHDASGYFNYFGKAAGNPTKGYYSYNLGAWHLIALNSQCSRLPRGEGVNGCAAGSPQNVWLRADLAAHHNRCTLAYWHRPPDFNPGHGDDSAVAAIWRVLHAGHADVVLTGHHHNYQRFVPLGATGRPEVGGMRQFVVGTGGKNENELQPNQPKIVQVRQDNTFGVLRMVLRPTRYRWAFVPEANGSFTDAGSSPCH